MEKDLPNHSAIAAAKKRVLIVSYYWPPAGGPGVQRWLKFVKYLPEFGISPVVCIPTGASYPIEDHTLLKETPGINILTSPISEPSKWISWLFKKQTSSLRKGMINEENPSFLEKLLRAIRGNLFVPDARVSWVKPTTALLKEYILTHQIDTVITTGPPHSVHLIGMTLKKELGLCWLADFRDPWTSIGYHKSLFMTTHTQKKHKKLEAAVLNSADHLIATSHTTAHEFEILTPSPIHVISNGFEPIQSQLSASSNIEEHMKGFSVLHIGSLLSKRNPDILWECFSELITEEAAFKREFSLHFVGEVSEQVKDRISDYGLTEFVIYHGYQPHSVCRAFQGLGQLLLLLEVNSEDHRGIIPGKLFEYMASNHPILAIGPEEWDVGAMLEETQSGAVFTYDEKAALKAHIFLNFSNYFTGELPSNTQGIERYHRKSLTSKLAKIIHGTGH